MKILLTGGTGYIGSHTAVALTEAGHEVVIVDNYVNSSRAVPGRLEQITGRPITCYEADVCDKSQLSRIFDESRPDAVIHFAGLKAVGESIEQPQRYYRNNIGSTLTLLECMKEHDVTRLVFSSSATVYGENNKPPFTEDMPRGECSSPYGRTKSMSEQIMTDWALADDRMSVVLLRYFNPIGAHESGIIGEDPQGIPNNLLPYIAQVAVGRRDCLTVFGDDYDTPDGTCRRDYIHVTDLAEGHVKAVQYAEAHTGTEIINLGTGRPYSVLEVIRAFERACGSPVRYRIGARRQGDLPELYANTDKARTVLGWEATRDLDAMCRDAWNWQRNNPEGYK